MKARFAIASFFVMQAVVLAAQTEEVEYYAVLMEGAKVGYATHSRVVVGQKVTTTETVSITINRMGTPLSIKTRESSVETTKGEPISFASEMDMGMGTSKTEGTVDRDGTVKVRTSTMGSVQETSLAWPEGAVMSEGLRLLVLKNGLKEGANYNLNFFSPAIMGALQSRVQVGGKQEVDLFGRVVTLTKVDTTMSMPGMGEMEFVSFVDDEYKALKTIMPMMDIKLELIACAKEFALGGNEVFEIAERMFLASPEPIVDVKTAKSITYYLKPVGDANSFAIPASDNQQVQRLEDGTVAVTVAPVSAPTGAKFPYNGTDKEIIEATKPNRFLQSDDAKIIGLAKRAVGDTKDAAEAARRIEAFVADYVDDISLSIGYASAAEVAVSKKGDCSEFAVLCAAMCRSVGIPTRVVAGVAYTESFLGKAGFGGHAWTEAYIGGKWVGLDAMFKASRHGGFDAGHIALAAGSGEPVDFFNVATTLGRFKIEKLAVSREK
jgi:hypothetical protein